MHIDWSTFLNPELDLAFMFSFLNIMFINLILSGDNAVLIAMAVRNLPKSQRTKGIIYGSVLAILLRVLLTYFVAILLEISFVKFIGGALILWIAVKLFTEADAGGSNEKEATGILQAIKIILIADLTMSIDNVLAVAAVARGNSLLLVSGLVMSIPMVVFTSNLLSTLMDKYPIIIVVGGAILGKVGGEMIMTDPFIERWLHLGAVMDYTIQAICTVGVVIVGKLWMKWKIAKEEKEAEISEVDHDRESR